MDMVLDIVPANFFTPFTEGNPLQIIFVAVLIGVALLVLGEKVSVTATFVEQSNYVVQLIMEAVAVMTALNVILEFLATAANLFCLQMALTDLGGSLGMLDVDTLRSRT